ncbi:hypothetical protein A8M60_04855 [Nocardia farcinica]|nr:hypothetical protein A8M60_04855 [Nocardia farcinica]
MRAPTTPIERELRLAHSHYANAHGRPDADELRRQVKVLRALNALDKGLSDLAMTETERGRFFALLAGATVIDETETEVAA